MLHGATDCNSSNYGDYIYGELIYDYIKNKGIDVCFYNASTFFKEHLDDFMDTKKFKFSNADGIVYIPGGYFGEGHNARFRDNLVQFLRFMPLGIKASFKKIPMVVLGIGAGPNKDFLMNYGIRKICNHSSVITVRDSESYKSLKNLCPKANIVEAGDVIITKKLNLLESSLQLNKIKDLKNNYKILLVHYNHSDEALIKFANAVKNFINNHPEYKVVVASDSILAFEEEYYQKFNQIMGVKCEHFIYKNPHEMTALLKLVDLVLTCKLHVGVVATTFDKSVIAIACHPEKTKRYYSQIGEEERCISLYNSHSKEIELLLEKYYDKNINIPNKVILKATKTWEILDSVIGDMNDDK